MSDSVSPPDPARKPEDAIDHALRLAVQQHQAGQLQDAERLYRAILQAWPDHPDANHNLGVLALQLKQPTQALPFFERALKADPSRSQSWVNYIDALTQAGHPDLAGKAFELARRSGLSPEAAENMAVKLQEKSTGSATRDSLLPGAGNPEMALRDESGGNTESLSPASKKRDVHRPGKGGRKPGEKEVNTLLRLYEQKKFGQAEVAARVMTRRFPDFGGGWRMLGAAVNARGQYAEAAAALRKAVDLSPGDVVARNHLGSALQGLGKLSEAKECYLSALDIDPDFADAHRNLGVVLYALGQKAAAEVSLRRALGIKPGDVEIHNSLGIVLSELGRIDDAILSYRQAIELAPDLPEPYNNLGNALLNKNQFAEAEAYLKRAIDIDPKRANIHNNLGIALQHLGRFEEAAASIRRALELDPGYAESHSNLGNIQQDLGRFEEAETSYRRALALKPTFADANHALGRLYLRQGRLQEGWEGYESRWTKQRAPVQGRPFLPPRWEGQPLAGKSIVVWGEQGLGDEMIFASMFPEVLAAAGRCVIECTHKLVPLFARSFPDAEVVARTDPPQLATLTGFDYQCASGSLAGLLRPSLDSFPRRERFLTSDTARSAYWKDRVAALGEGLKIGFSWRSGNMSGTRGLSFSVLDNWKTLFALPGVHFVNLQYGDCADELAEASEKFDVSLHAFDEVDLFDDIDEAAALTSAMDIVISAPTSVSCLSGALGVETWMTGIGRPWEMLGTDHFPWFPSVRYFERQWNQSWEDVFQVIAQELRRRL